MSILGQPRPVPKKEISSPMEGVSLPRRRSVRAVEPD
jgi:hypothetical protein